MPNRVFDSIEFSEFLSEAELATLVETLADQIRRDYQGKTLLLVGVLKGAYVFMADLMRALKMDIEIDFVRLSSYGKEKESSGTITLIKDISRDIQGRHVLIVDEITDTGQTLRFLYDRLLQSNPASLEVVALLDKYQKRIVEVPVKYTGKKVENAFLIGYGLDLDERVRNMPEVMAMVTK